MITERMSGSKRAQDIQTGSEAAKPVPLRCLIIYLTKKDSAGNYFAYRIVLCKITKNKRGTKFIYKPKPIGGKKMKNLIITAVLGISMAMASMAIAGGGDETRPATTATGKKIWYCRGEGNAPQSFIPFTVQDNKIVVNIKKVEDQEIEGKLEDFGVYMSYIPKIDGEFNEDNISLPGKNNYKQESKVVEGVHEAALSFSGSDVGLYHLRTWIFNPVTGEYLWIDQDDPFCRNARNDEKSPAYEAIVDVNTGLVSPVSDKYQKRL